MRCTDLWDGKTRDIDRPVETIRHDDSFVLSIPHGGTLVPAGYEAKLRVGQDLWLGTDTHTMRVYEAAEGTTVRFLINPNCVNTNRDRTPIADQDPEVPDHLRKDPLHSNSLLGPRMLLEEPTPEEAELLFGLYDAYREALKGELERLRERNGSVFMLDCHSLNSVGLQNVPDQGSERADFVVGTNDGRSADPRIARAFIEALERAAAEHGWTVAVDDPYKGGSITRTYGRPEQGWHVLQLETKRALFMNEGLDAGDPQAFAYDEQGAKKVNAVVLAAVREAEKKRREKEGVAVYPRTL